MFHFIHKFFGIVHKNGWRSFIALGSISYILSIIGYVSMSDSGFESWILIKAFVLSFADLPSDDNGLIIFAKLFWMLTFASAAFSLFLKEWSEKQLFKSIKEDDHTAIIGIGELSHNYINHLDPSDTIIYNNKNRASNEIFFEKDFAMQTLFIDEILNDIKISSMKKALINTGDDKSNINCAFNIIEQYISSQITHPLRLIIKIENKELNALFMSNKIFTAKNSELKERSIEIKTYSFFEECAINLFEENFIDGDDDTILNSCDEYAIAVVGNGKLANKIIYEIGKIAHLPNENVLNIYLVCDEPSSLKNTLLRNYPYIENIPSIKIHEYPSDYKSLDFYTNSIWDTKNLTNIIVCYDDENINLEIASSMQDKTFLHKDIVHTKVLFGMFNQNEISKKLDADDANFKNFKSFGNSQTILTKENVFDDANHLIAKLINYTYDLLANEKYETPYDGDAMFDYHTNQDKIDKKWFKSTYSDKSSSMAQAKHIKMKLKSLGLTIAQSNKSLTENVQFNRKILNDALNIDYKGGYLFPNSFDDILFHKMIRLEHNRWNAYHYLNGWQYSKQKNKDKKQHDCLLPLCEFPQYFPDKKRLTDLIEWDIYATMYIPNYLAEIGYELVNKSMVENGDI